MTVTCGKFKLIDLLGRFIYFFEISLSSFVLSIFYLLLFQNRVKKKKKKFTLFN